MYPVRLYLKNFLSYGELGTEIDFKGYKILLLIGKNGAGKSSILDALLWALWGKTRGGGDNDIMHSGSSDMEVRLDFVVRDAPYRVVRKRSKKGKGFVSVLELQSLTEPITVLTDATIIQTQARLDDLIGVDYELLVNSAFLRQGQAQEFSQKSPSKRKQLLASLLGLEKYTSYHEEAKKQLRKNEIELTQIERDISQAEQTLVQYEQELTQQKASLSALDQHSLETHITETEKNLQALQLKTHLVAEWDQQILLATQKSTHLRNKIADLRKSSDNNSQKLLSLQKEITNIPQNIDETSWEKVEAEFSHGQDMYQKYQDITYRIETLQNQIQRHRIDTDQQLQVLQHKLQTLELDRATNTITVQTQTDTQNSLLKKQQALLDLTRTIAQLEQQMESIIAQGNQINKRKETVNTIDGECPLCEQHIDAAHKHTILDKYTQERDALLLTYQEYKKTHDQSLREKQTLEQDIKTLSDTVHHQQILLNALQVQQAQQEGFVQQISALKQRQQDQLQSLETEIMSYTQAKEALAFDPLAWETIKTKKAALQEAHILAQKYQSTRLQIHELEQNYTFQLVTLTEAQNELKTIEEHIKTLEAQKPQPEDIETVTQLQNNLITLKKQYQYYLQLHALITHRETEQKNLTEKLDQLKIQRSTATQKMSALVILAEALGNKGIPQMLIEESIPRLEHYANEVLTHLSDNTMSIRLSLTRPSKTDRDAQIETLDILIGDSVGTRAYELFSGGEAFRIDIALRIALTKLLTEHTHGSIDFLVIDEGFGSQDDTGCDHITHIIHQLETYFHLILIITHVDELKETFPDRLVIKKGPQGSEVFYDDD